MKKSICLLLAILIPLAGCAGREANPVPVYLPGDENRSCAGLQSEIAQLQVDMQRILPKVNKGVSNTLWATAGVFLIVPFFFMDLKDAEKIEFEALRARHNRLLVYAAEKGCNMAGINAERIPSIAEMKEMAKNAKTADATETNTCKVCGHTGDSSTDWTIKNGEVMCMDCYMKQKASTSTTKTD